MVKIQKHGRFLTNNLNFGAILWAIVRDKEKTYERYFVEHQIFYPQKNISFLIRLTVQLRTGFGKNLH